MKIVVTIADASDAAYVGGEVERESAIIDIPDDSLPELLKGHLRYTAEAKAKNQPCYSSVSLSILQEPQPELKSHCASREEPTPRQLERFNQQWDNVFSERPEKDTGIDPLMRGIALDWFLMGCDFTKP